MESGFQIIVHLKKMIDMKKIILVAAFAIGSVIGASAQEGKVAYPAMMELSRAKATWFNTSNAAGMAITPLDQYADLSVGYNSAAGEFRRQQEGNLSELNVNTSGTAKIGGIIVWGEFDYKNTTQKETKYRTMNIDVEDDMPFYVADHRESEWKYQAYDLKVKGATPFFWDWLGFGLYANYTAKSGAKQLDPRCKDFVYSIIVEPSALVKLGKHNIGLTFKYKTGHERTVPINSNSQQDQDIYIMRGLGNFTQGVIGGIGGLGTFYYNTNRIGGAAQYGFNTKGFSAVAEGYYTIQSIDVMQSPSKPKAMGSTLQKIAGGSLNASLSCCKNTHTLAVNGLRRSTNGIEYIQVLNSDYNVQQWQTIAEYVRSNYKLTALDFEYNFFRNSDYGYNWMAGVRGNYSKEEDIYYTPESTFKVSNFFTDLFVKKNIMVDQTSIVLGINGGYNHNISLGYNYEGADADARTVMDFMFKDCSMRGAHYWTLGANFNITFPIRSNAMIYLKGSLQYYRSNDKANNYQYSEDVDGNPYLYIKTGSSAHRSQRTLANLTLGLSF